MAITDLVLLADTPASCAECEKYRAALGEAIDGWATERQERIKNLDWCNKRVAFNSGFEKEELRITMGALQREQSQFFLGDKCKGRVR